MDCPTHQETFTKNSSGSTEGNELVRRDLDIPGNVLDLEEIDSSFSEIICERTYVQIILRRENITNVLGDNFTNDPKTRSNHHHGNL